MADVSVVVVTYDALPWLERCLESVRGYETVVVDNGSTDGTVAVVRDRFPEVRIVERENDGLAAGWNTGVEATSTPYVFLLTVAIQAWRVLAIWLAGKSVGVDLSPRPYYVMGPLLFLVLLVPFTINGLAVRESFFVSFLGQLGVDGSKAFATGFLFFVVTLATSLPGAFVLAWENLRGSPRRRVPAEP